MARLLKGIGVETEGGMKKTFAGTNWEKEKSVTKGMNKGFSLTDS